MASGRFQHKETRDGGRTEAASGDSGGAWGTGARSGDGVARGFEGAAKRGADAIILDLEDAVAASEKERARTLVPEAAALATASGQAAETLAITTLANAGDEIVSTTSLYGGTYNLFHYTLPKLGITVKFVDADDFDGLRKAITPKR